MSKLRNEIARITINKRLKANVVEVLNDYVTVRLPSGQLLRSLPYIGQRPSSGQSVYVDYTAGNPIVYFPQTEFKIEGVMCSLQAYLTSAIAAATVTSPTDGKLDPNDPGTIGDIPVVGTSWGISVMLPATAGLAGYVEVPFNCRLTAVELLADVNGNMVVDIWKIAGPSFPPSDANSITSSTPPTLSGTKRMYNTTLAGWNTTFSKKDVLAFNVDSVATVTLATLALSGVRT